MQGTAQGKRVNAAVGKIKHVFTKQSRQKKVDHFYSLYGGGNVLDVGVSSNQQIPFTNFFLNTFQPPGGCYTGLGIEDLTGIAALHHDKSFVRYAGGVFPFKDKAFEWVFSNAVIEHVGPAEKQLQFVAEMLRVGRRVFFTTPNKFFLVETHTNLPLVHWHDGLLDLWCARFRPRLRGNLHLLSYRQLDTLMQKTNAHYTIYRNRLLLPMGVLTPTFTVACSKTASDWDSIRLRKVGMS